MLRPVLSILTYSASIALAGPTRYLVYSKARLHPAADSMESIKSKYNFAYIQH